MASDDQNPEAGPAAETGGERNREEPDRPEDIDADPEQSLPSPPDTGEAGPAAGNTAAPKNPGTEEPPFSVAFGGGGTLVDRDEDGDTDGDGATRKSFIDSDYAEDFPGVPGGDAGDSSDREDPDPGYAAFSDGFDDPLADWPAPDADLASLSEARVNAGPEGGAAKSGTLATEDVFASIDDDAGDGDAEHGTLTRSDDRMDQGPAAAFFDDPVGSEGKHSLDDDYRDPTSADTVGDLSGAPPREAVTAALTVDRDEPAPVSAVGAGGVSGSESDDDLPAAPDIPLPSVTELPDPPDIDDIDEGDYGALDRLPEASADDLDGATAADDGDEDDAFIDDFLNDLDDPGSDPGSDSGTDDQVAGGPDGMADVPEDVPGAMSGDMSGDEARDTVFDRTADWMDEADNSPPFPLETTVMKSEVGRFDVDDDATAKRATARAEGAGKVTAETQDDDSGLPWGMIAVVAVALILLAAGGFGVVQQRSSLKDEIRDLQAQLATAVAPEEAAAARERQRQIELENESLGAEVSALRAENEALSTQLEEFEVRLEEQREAQQTAAREARAAAAEAARSAAESAAQPVATSAGSGAGDAASSGWFVNFGSYAQEPIARRWADRLEVSGGRVVVQEARASGRTLYRVRVVGLPSQDAAERVATALERQHQLPRLWVGRN